jgi:hypothetical protein
MGCQHLNTHIEREPESSYHWAARVYDKCQAQLGYVSRGSNLNRRAADGSRIQRLLTYQGLSNHDRGYLGALWHVTTRDLKTKLSPKQRETLERLCVK